MEVIIDASVIDDIEKKLTKVSSKTMTAIGQTVKSDILINYIEEKSPDGKRWADLKPSTLESKIRKSGTVRKLQDTGNLKKSLNFKAKDGSVEVGYGIGYSVFHQLGTRDMVVRKILPTEESEVDMEEIERLILEDINV